MASGFRLELIHPLSILIRVYSTVMTQHLFKVQLQHSDMFIVAIDLAAETITYQIREHTGKLLEPVKTSGIELHDDKYYFDSRWLHIDLIQHIIETLK